MWIKGYNRTFLRDFETAVGLQLLNYGCQNNLNLIMVTVFISLEI